MVSTPLQGRRGRISCWTARPKWIGTLAAVAALTIAGGQTPSPSDGLQPPERELKALLDAGAQHSSDSRMLVRLAGLYLDVGDDVLTEPDERQAAYEAGAGLAKRAIELKEQDAEAHYYYAANLGSAVQLKGMMASAFTVRDLKAHVSRALELQHDHAPSLHMMGMMLAELPWMLGGDPAAALTYLRQAVAVDPRYEHARLDLAKAYLKHHDREAARRELQAIVTMASQPVPQATVSRYVLEAKQLLTELEQSANPGARP